MSLQTTSLNDKFDLEKATAQLSSIAPRMKNQFGPNAAYTQKLYSDPKIEDWFQIGMSLVRDFKLQLSLLLQRTAEVVRLRLALRSQDEQSQEQTRQI